MSVVCRVYVWTDHDPFQKSFLPVLKGEQTQPKGSGGLGVKFERYIKGVNSCKVINHCWYCEVLYVLLGCPACTNVGFFSM